MRPFKSQGEALRSYLVYLASKEDTPIDILDSDFTIKEANGHQLLHVGGKANFEYSEDVDDYEERDYVYSEERWVWNTEGGREGYLDSEGRVRSCAMHKKAREITYDDGWIFKDIASIEHYQFLDFVFLFS